MRYDWFSAGMRRQMILDPLSPTLRDRRGGPELDYMGMRGELLLYQRLLLPGKAKVFVVELAYNSMML